MSRGDSSLGGRYQQKQHKRLIVYDKIKEMIRERIRGGGWSPRMRKWPGWFGRGRSKIEKRGVSHRKKKSLIKGMFGEETAFFSPGGRAEFAESVRVVHDP